MIAPPLAALALTGACKSEEVAVPETASTTVEDVAEEPFDYAGKQVTLVGEVDNVFGERSFELEGNDWLFDEELLVVSKNAPRLGGRTIEDGDEVVVTGTVRMMTTDVERDTGWDLSSEVEVEWEGKPVLVATSVRRVGEYDRWSETEEPEGVVGLMTIYTVAEPEKLVDRQISLTAVPVMNKAGNGLWLGYSHRAMTFVEPPEGFDAAGVEVGELVDVKGKLQKMPPAKEAMQKWAFDRSLSTQIAEEVLYIDADSMNETVRDPAAQAAGGMGEGDAIDYAMFAKDPASHVDVMVTGEAVVDEAVTDRAFWLKTADGAGKGERILAIVREDVPRPDMIDIKGGQTIKFSARALSPDEMEKEVNGKLEEETKKLIQGQKVFLAMHHKEVNILSKR